MSQIVTKRKHAKEHRQLLINELNHRVKNTLAVAPGLAQQSCRDKRVPLESRPSFKRRLMALAAAQNVTRENWMPAPIRRSIGDALPRFGRARFDFDRPNLCLAPRAESLALAPHALANAANDGALLAGGGGVELAWTADPSAPRGSALHWREVGGSAVEAPVHRGFGSRLIEREVAIDYLPEGRRCNLRAPLDRPAA